MTDTSTGPRRDLIDEVEARLRRVGARLRPGVERALDEMDRQAASAEAAVRRMAPEVERKWNERVRPRVDEATRRARPQFDRAVRETQPALDRLLRFLTEQLERLRSGLERRAERAAARGEETTSARPPAPLDASPPVEEDAPPPGGPNAPGDSSVG